MNLPYKVYVILQNMSYFFGSKRNGSAQAYLDETDYEKIINSFKFYARKIGMKISKELLELIDKNLKIF